MFLEISQNSQENTCARVSFLIKLQVFSCEPCETSKNTFSYRTPLVAVSGYTRDPENLDFTSFLVFKLVIRKTFLYK